MCGKVEFYKPRSSPFQVTHLDNVPLEFVFTTEVDEEVDGSIEHKKQMIDTGQAESPRTRNKLINTTKIKVDA